VNPYLVYAHSTSHGGSWIEVYFLPSDASLFLTSTQQFETPSGPVSVGDEEEGGILGAERHLDDGDCSAVAIRGVGLPRSQLAELLGAVQRA
jgi:hypothetical protein